MLLLEYAVTDASALFSPGMEASLIYGDAEAGGESKDREDDTGVVIMALGKRFGNSACDEDAVDDFRTWCFFSFFSTKMC